MKTHPKESVCLERGNIKLRILNSADGEHGRERRDLGYQDAHQWSILTVWHSMMYSGRVARDGDGVVKVLIDWWLPKDVLKTAAHC